MKIRPVGAELFQADGQSSFAILRTHLKTKPSTTNLHNFSCMSSRRSAHIDAGAALQAEIMEQFMSTTEGSLYCAFCEINSCLEARRPTALIVPICLSYSSNNTLHVRPLSEYGSTPTVLVVSTENTDSKQLESVSVTYWNIHQTANNSFHHRT